MAETSIEWTDARNPCRMYGLRAGCSNVPQCAWQRGLKPWAWRNTLVLTPKSGGRAKWTGKIHLDHKGLVNSADMVKAAQGFCELDVRSLPRRRVGGLHRRCLGRHGKYAATHLPDIVETTGSHDRDHTIILPKLANVWLGTKCADSRVLHKSRNFARFRPVFALFRLNHLSAASLALI